MKKLRIVLVGVLVAGGAYLVGPSTAATATGDRHGGGSGVVQNTDQPLRVLARRHNLRVGTAVDMNAFNADEVYKDRVNSEFSAVTPENAMKWGELEPTRGTYNWEPADQLVANARRNGQIVHGHTLAWHNQLPTWLTEGVADGSIDAAEFRDLVRRHIFTVAGRYRGKIAHWDVVNEIFTDGDNPVLRDTVYLQMMGPNYVEDLFRWAHKADPKAKLWLNDYAIDGINAKSTAYLNLAKSLLAKGVPLHGMGFQGHLDLQYPIPHDATDNIRRFDAIGLQTGFTEVDVRYFVPGDTYKTAGQVGSFNVLLQACLLTPRCELFTFWGFTDKYSWVPGWFNDPLQGEATPLDENFNAKPAYRALQQLLSLPAAPGKRRY